MLGSPRRRFLCGRAATGVQAVLGLDGLDDIGALAALLTPTVKSPLD
jgi:hypothetical protein